MIVLTNLRPKSADLIFYAPDVANLGFLRIGSNRESLCPKIRRGCFKGLPNFRTKTFKLSQAILDKMGGKVKIDILE